MKIFLHIGAGKCASSSIQNFFSYENVISDFAYVVVTRFGNILDSDDVQLKAELSPNNYAASLNFENGIDEGFVSKFRESIDALSKKYSKILLSSEGWGAHAGSFAMLARVFEGHEVEVVYIVRPPVLWMNSAWWQWQQWDDTNIDAWVNSSNVAEEWVKTIEAYRQLHFINKIHTLALQKNIIEQVASIIGIDITVEKNVHNSASSSELLNFFKLKRSLRVGPHESESEFILNRYLAPRSKVDWVLSKGNIETILSNSRQACMELSNLVGNEDIKNNGLWWNIEEYIEKLDGFTRDNPISYEDMSSMLEEAYQVIIELDNASRARMERTK